MAENVLSRLLLVFGADTTGLEKDMTRVDSALKRVQTEMTKTRNVTGLLAGAAGFGFVAKQAFDMASEVEETGSKFSTVFGDSTGEVEEFIDRFGTLAGLSETQAKGVLATTGSIVQGLGFAQDASASFATEVVKLSGDLSSFNNVPIAETSAAIQSALTGEREQLKRLGIVLRETDVQQRALANSGKTSATALTDQEKATATLQLITERAGVAVGDLARTQDSAANQARAVGAEIQNIKESIATALLPVMSVAVTGFGQFIKGLQIMGAEAAVLVARLNFWKEAALGTEESTMAANDVLRQMRIAAEEVKNQVIGLTFSSEGLSNSLAGTGGGGAPSVVGAVTATNVAMDQTGLVGDVAITVFEGLEATAQGAASQVAGLKEEMASLKEQMLGIAGFLGKIGGLAGLFGGFGPVGGILGKASSLLGFAGGFAGDGKGPLGDKSLKSIASSASVASPGSASMKVDFINLPAPSNPLAVARDNEWLRVLHDSMEHLAASGAA